VHGTCKWKLLESLIECVWLEVDRIVLDGSNLISCLDCELM
jgi:hypothetical protein